MLEHVLERDEVIHRRTRHEDVFLDDARDRVPLRFIVVDQRATVAEVVEYERHADHDGSVDGDLQGSRRHEVVRQLRDGEKCSPSPPAEQRVRDVAENQQNAVVLVKEDVQQIVLLGLLAQPECAVVRLYGICVQTLEIWKKING